MVKAPIRRKERHVFADLAGIGDAVGIMQDFFQFPVHCAGANMQLMQDQFTTYSEFAQRCAKCQEPEGFVEEYAHFGERMMADFSNYLIDVADAFGAFERAMSGRVGFNLAA